MKDLPIEWDTVKKEGAANFLIGRSIITDAQRPVVILSGHIDTVLPSRGMERKGDLVYGSGVNDMKGGIVSMLEVTRQLSEEGLLQNLIIAISPEEEIATPNHRSTIASVAQEGDYVMVFEANQSQGLNSSDNKYKRKKWELVNSRKGAMVYEIRYSGPGGHSGAIFKKEERMSASIPAADTILGIETLADYDLETTLNSGIITSGSAVNVLSPEAKIIGEARYWTLQERDRVRGGLEGLVGKLLSKYPGITGNIQFKGEFPPLERSEQNENFSNMVQKVAEEIGIDLEITTRAGSSEANFFSTGNSRIAVLDGFGVWGQDEHKETERASLTSLQDSIQFAKAVIKSLQG